MTLLIIGVTIFIIGKYITKKGHDFERNNNKHFKNGNRKGN